MTIEVTRCDVRQGGPPAPTVLANLVRPLLLQVAANLAAVPDRLIISGVELHETEEVVAAFARHVSSSAPGARAAAGPRSSYGLTAGHEGVGIHSAP